MGDTTSPTTKSARLIAVLLRRSSATLALPASERDPDAARLVATIAHNLEPLGFVLARDVLENWTAADAGLVTRAGLDLLDAAREIRGAHVAHQPMYPNFPPQVMEASDAELYLNAYLHYFGDLVGARIVPLYATDPRQRLSDEVTVRPLTLTFPADVAALASRLMSANGGLSETDRDDLGVLLAWDPRVFVAGLPSVFTNRENLATVTALLLGEGLSADALLAQAKSATDALRLAAALSGGDASLAEPTRFASFSRRRRRMILAIIDAASDPVEDMIRRPEMFKRLGERLHSGEFARPYPAAAAAFSLIRKGEPVETFNSRVEALVGSVDSVGAARLLATRPGELARRLDELVRLDPAHGSEVVDVFERVADAVATRVLLQARAHFSDRAHQVGQRAFFPKGNVSKIRTVANALRPLDEALRTRLVAVLDQALVTVFAQRPPLGKVYIDPTMHSYAVPLSARSASRALRTAGRGSRLPLPTSRVLRLFLWWKDQSAGPERQRVDLDLSAVLFDESFAVTIDVAYYNLRAEGCFHSGDITSAPQGASEFIDVDVDTLRRNGFRYVVMVVTSFTDQPFRELPGCFAGFMGRDRPQSGEIFEPSTVQDRWDLSGDQRIAVPMVVDLVTGEMVWTDLTLGRNLQAVTAAATNHASLAEVARAMIGYRPPTVHDLLVAHATARGELVTDRSQADLVVALDGDLSPLDVDRLLADYV